MLDIKGESDMANAQRIGYTRVSSADQNNARQLEGIPLDRVFSDRASGKDVNRPQLDAALAFIRDGDTLVVHSMDRLARNLDDLRRIVLDLTKRGVSVEFAKERLTFTGEDSPMANLLLSVMGAFAQFERELIKERQREGIALAKAKGNIYRGRVPSLSAEKASILRDRVTAGESKAKLAREFGISRASLYNYMHASCGLLRDALISAPTDSPSPRTLCQNLSVASMHARGEPSN